MRIACLLSVCVALGIAGCGGGDSTADTPAEVLTFPEVKTQVPERPEPKIKLPDGPPPTKLIVEDLIEGRGAPVKDGDRLTVAYLGVYYVNGRRWSNSWERPTPLTFILGAGDKGIMEGWEKGLKGMKLGGRRMLIIPPRLVYERPLGTSREDTLLFYVDLLAVNKNPVN